MARQQISGKIGSLFVMYLVIYAIAFAFGLPSILFEESSYAQILNLIGSYVVLPPLSIGILIVHLKLMRAQNIEFKDIFSGFDDIWSAIKLNFLTALFTALWTLLFFIPGIVMGLAYSQARFILAENKGIGAREALRQSKEMMRGYKTEYFVLSLSFLGWILLSCITLGIAFVWVAPYMQQTIVNFYNDRRTQYLRSIQQTVEQTEI